MRKRKRFKVIKLMIALLNSGVTQYWFALKTKLFYARSSICKFKSKHILSEKVITSLADVR